METQTPEVDAVPPAAGRAPRLHAATLMCENCGQETPHRILRMSPIGSAGSGHLSGTARCRQCQWTHRFDIVAPSTVEVAVVVSDGPRSTRRRISLPSNSRVELGTPVPVEAEPAEVQRIESRTGHSVSSARATEIATLWVTRHVGAVVPVSVVEGARTWTDRLNVAHTVRLAVGDTLTVRSTRLRIVGLRARGRTWRLPEDGFSADEIQRIYARRADSPPAGRSPWRTVRERPSSRARETSTSERSRSGPGDRRKRTFPRAPRADGGAADQSVSPR
jgi:uncharacterized Zn finger protein